MVLADVETVRARYEDHRLRDTVRRQLEAADLLVLNKCDRVSEGEIEETEVWARHRSGVPTIRSIDADVPVELLRAVRLDVPAPPATGERDATSPTDVPFSAEAGSDTGTGVPPHRAGAPGPGTREPAPDHSHRFLSRFVPCPDPVDPDRLRAALSSLAPRVLRAKGFVVSAADPGREWLVVQASGRTVDVERRDPSPEHSIRAPGIVFIGLDDLPGVQELAGVVSSAGAPHRGDI